MWPGTHKVRYARRRHGRADIESYKARFIELLAEHEVIRFGAFTLKSGRKSPYFVNAGQIRTGRAIARLGEAYARRLIDAGLRCDLVFGPAYKGIPLAVATATALAERGPDVAFAFDRKELKDHGEKGRFVGAQPRDGLSIVVVDDVVTSGLSVRHSVELLRSAAKVRIAGVVIAVDREERGPKGRSTLKELEEELGAPVLPVVTIREVLDFLSRHDVRGKRLSPEHRKAVESYLERHGPLHP